MPRITTRHKKEEVVEYTFSDKEVEEILKRKVAKDFAFQRSEVDFDISYDCLHNVTIIAWSADEMED